MVASLTFAQAPLAKKKPLPPYRLERVADMDAFVKKAKEAKELRAVAAEKAAAANETSFSVLRKNTVKRGYFNSIDGTVIKTWKLDGRRSNLANTPYRSAAQKTTTQEGNVTVTTDANGIITDVAGVEPKLYQRANTGTAYYNNSGSISKTTQSGMVTVVEDGNNVWIKNPITRYTTGAWVKGTKNGNVITVAAKQPLNFDASYAATVSLRWGVITVAGKVQAADDYAEAFTYTVSGNVLTLEGTNAYDGTADAYFMGAYWDDDNSPSGYGDARRFLHTTRTTSLHRPSLSLFLPVQNIQAGI